MIHNTLRLALFMGFVAQIFIVSCSSDDPNSDNSINLFSIKDDKELGAQVAAQIDSDVTNYPVLPEAQFPEAYQHLRRIRDSLLNAGNVKYKDEFLWQTKIIRDDSTLNAFCTPGGYIYVYTGLIKYLDSEDQLAGIMGHEIAHADRRHSTDQLTKAYGLEFLLNAALGKDKGLITTIAANLAKLSFSRANESEADEYSVIYQYPTSYDARGAAGFFKKLDSQSKVPAFLSTHPNPDDRVVNIEKKWSTLGGKVGETYVSSYQTFKNSLP